MLVTCRGCRTGFDPSVRSCPVCGTAPPINDRREHLVAKTVERLRAGDGGRVACEGLVDLGLADTAADDIVAEATGRWRRSNRRLGGGQIVRGLGLLLFAGMVAPVPLPRGLSIAPTGMAAFGLAMAVVGVIMEVTGCNLEREGPRSRSWVELFLDRRFPAV